MSERENFEEAASRLGFNLTMAEHETGEYHYQVTQDAWDIWHEATYAAAREQEGGEAVAEIHDYGFDDRGSVVKHLVDLNQFPNGTKLYTHPSQSQGVPEGQIVDCPYACGWQNLQSIITRNAAYFARETIDDDFPEEIRQSGIASGQYALELCRFARRLSTPAAPQADEWVRCVDREPTSGTWLTYRPDAPIDSQVVTLWHDQFHNGWSGKYKVVAWMDRPQPPEQEDGV